MTVSLFVLFCVRGWSRDLVAAGEEGWTFDQSGRKLLLPNFLAERGRTNSGSSWRSVGTRQVTLYSLVVLLLRPSLHTRQCPSHILHQHPPQQHLPLYIPAATHSRPCFLQSSFVIIIRTRETQPLKLAPCATTFLLFQAAFSSLLHPSVTLFLPFHSIFSSLLPPSPPDPFPINQSSAAPHHVPSASAILLPAIIPMSEFFSTLQIPASYSFLPSHLSSIDRGLEGAPCHILIPLQRLCLLASFVGSS